MSEISVLKAPNDQSPDPEIVEVVERLLERAKDGSIRGLVYGYSTNDGSHFTGLVSSSDCSLVTLSGVAAQTLYVASKHVQAMSSQGREDDD